MGLSDLILNKGEVVVIRSESSIGIVGVGTGINFGTVQMVNDLCDSVSVGTSVWFDLKDATPFMVVSGQVFYKLREEHITGNEPPIS